MNNSQNLHGLTFKSQMRFLVAGLVLLVCLLVITGAWYSNHMHAMDRAKARFHQEVSRSTTAIRDRLAVYEDALYGTRAFLEANSPVTRNTFHNYIANLRLAERYPGIQGIGYAIRIPKDKKADHIEEVRRQGFPQYSIHPEGEREEYTSIIYLEPFDWRNQRAFGYDMFTEAVRHEAMEQARDTGITSVSGKVKLVQETATDVQAGFLIYLPLYRKGGALATIEDRRSALLAYVYSPFRMNDLMRGVISEEFPLASFEIYSGTNPSPKSLMYRFDNSPDHDALFKETAEIKFGGQTWTLSFSSLSSINRIVAEGANSLIVPAGILLSLLLSGLIFSSGRTEVRAIRLAETMTSKLRASEARTRAITESAADAIISADSNGRIMYFNSSAERMFGQTASEVMGQLLTVLMPERYRSGHEKGLERFLQTHESHVIGRSVELVGLHKAGGEFPVNLSLASWVSGTETWFTGILQDISERKQAEEALRRSEERYRNLFELNPHPVWVYDRATLRFLTVNTAAVNSYGYAEKEFLERTILDIRPNEDAEAVVKSVSALHDGQRVTALWRHRTKEGRLLHVEVSSYALLFGGRPATLAISVDITERKRAEEEIRALNTQLQRHNLELTTVNQELETFSYSVSHDLRAPLRAIAGFSSMLLEDYGNRLNEEGTDLLDRIRAATAHMGQLIDDLLRLARTARQKLHVETVNLSALAQEIASQMQAFDPKRKVAFVIAPELFAEGDRGLLRLALENLLGNAWKFTSKQAEAHIEFGQQMLGSEQVFYVADNGAGFDMTYADKLFGAFQRLHDDSEFPGTGIGLATVQRVIHRHGGRIWAESHVGNGAKFYFVMVTSHKTAVMSRSL